jgi:hypothetical protein
MGRPWTPGPALVAAEGGPAGSVKPYDENGAPVADEKPEKD